MATLTHTPKTLTEAIAALGGRDTRKIGNNTYLVAIQDSGMVAVTLHGSQIVRYEKDQVTASWAGYVTSTTTNRIHQLIDGRANIKGGEPHLNGKQVNAYAWTRV